MQAKAIPRFYSYLKGLFTEVRVTFKESGMKGVIRRFGWKIFAVFFVYYLVRDSILYILIPYLVAKHFIN